MMRKYLNSAAKMARQTAWPAKVDGIFNLPDPRFKRGIEHSMVDAAPKIRSNMLDKHGGDYKKFGLAVELDPDGYVTDTMVSIMSNDKGSQIQEVDPAPTNNFFKESLSSPSDHFYMYSGDNIITNAAEAIQRGDFPANDISTMVSYAGMLDPNIPEEAAIIREFNAAKSNVERGNILSKNADRVGGNHKKQVESKKPFQKGARLIIGHNMVEVLADKFIETANGKIRALLLRADVAHSLGGVIIHAHAQIGPNTVRSYVIGVGKSNAFGTDHVNAYVGPPMWALMKRIGSLRWEFDAQQASGKIGKDVKWEDHFFEHHPDLARELAVYKLMIGSVQSFAIWYNQFFGQYGYQAPSVEEYVRRLEIDKAKDDKGRIDIDKIVFYSTEGEKEYPGQEKLERAIDFHDGGLSYRDVPLDPMYSFLCTVSTIPLAGDDEAKQIVDQNVIERMSGMLDPLRAEWQEKALRVVEEFMQQHPELKKLGLNVIEDIVYQQSRLAEQMQADVSALYREAEPQLLDDVNFLLSERPEPVDIKALGELLAESYRWNIERAYTHNDGRFMQPVVEQGSARAALDYNESQQTQLQHDLQELERHELQISTDLQQAEVERKAKETAETRAAYDHLKKQKENNEQEQQRKKAEIEQHKTERGPLEKRMEKSREDVKQFDPKNGHGGPHH